MSEPDKGRPRRILVARKGVAVDSPSAQVERLQSKLDELQGEVIPGVTPPKLEYFVAPDGAVGIGFATELPDFTPSVVPSPDKLLDESILAHFNRAKAATDKRQAAMERINGTLNQAEQHLADLDLRVPAYVVLAEDECDHCQLLSFERENRQWRLMYKSGTPGDDQPWEVMPVIKAPRSVRVKALKALPSLIKAIADQAEEEAEELNGEANAAASVVSTLKHLVAK